MAIQQYAVGKPAEAPMILKCEESDLAAHLEEGWVSFPYNGPTLQRCVINATGNDVEIVPPTLEETRGYARDDVNRIRAKAQSLVCQTPKGPMDAHDAAKANLVFHFTSALASDDPNWSIDWTMADNTVVNHTKAELSAAVQTIAAYHAACHAHALDLKEEINAASDEDAVWAIDPTVDWPD